MELDPRRLRVLRAVALRGGVVDAARLLRLTPSAVSQQLQQLEHEAGVRLVDRSRRRVGLTAAGRMLVARAERIEQELAEARRELAELSGRVSGPVVVAGFLTAIVHLLVPALRAMAVTHPELRPRILEMEGPEALRELRTGGVDLVVAEHDVDGPDPAPHHPDLFAEPVADDEYRIVIPADWAPSCRSITDLAARPWVAAPAGTACGRALDRLAARYGFAPDRAHVCVEFPVVLALVAAGFGAAILPTLALGAAPPEGTVALTLPVPGIRRITALRRMSRSGPEPVAGTLVAELRAAAAQLGLAAGRPPAETARAGEDALA
jgi:Transcriptional regulator